MRKPRLAALLASGNAAASPVLRAIAAAQAIGPVASTSFRVASRIANSMRAGRAAPSVDAFEACHVVLISAPDRDVDAAVAQLTAAPFEWEHRTVILIGDESEPLAPLRELGAVTGVVTTMPGFEERLFLLEGERAALRELRPLLGRTVRVILIPPGARARFDAAITLAGHALFPLLVAADAAFASTGLSRRLTDPVLEKAVQRALRAWINGRRKGWGTLDGPGEARLASQIAVLERADPRAGAYFRGVTETMREFMR
jgi:hypothetical protein